MRHVINNPSGGATRKSSGSMGYKKPTRTRSTRQPASKRTAKKGRMSYR